VQVSGFASFIVASKLKYIKNKLKIWNREVFGDIKIQKHKFMGMINSLDMKEASSSLSTDEHLQRTDAKADWAKITLMEEISWRQKSRALWFQSGDRNTVFS